jgi:hypothetical protein
MTEPDLDQELARLLSVTRSGTEPDANARARVRAALAVGLASGGGAKPAPLPRAGLAAKLWLLSALAVLVLVGVVLSGSPEKASLVPAPVRPSAAASLVAAPPAVEPAPLPSAPPSAVAALSASALARPASSQPRAPAHAEGPADELTLVSSMQLALRSGNASQALALASEHARRFPSGALAQEREGARAIARCQLAEPAARAAILDAFAARYAGSPYAARVKAACSP